MLLKLESALKKDAPRPVAKSSEPRTTVQAANARLAAEVQIRLAKEAVDALRKSIVEAGERSDDAVREARRKLMNAEESLKKANNALALDQWASIQIHAKRAQSVAVKARSLLLSEPLEFQPEADVKAILER